MQTGQGTVHITSIHGISAEELTCVAKELGVTQSALATFCEILEQKRKLPLKTWIALYVRSRRTTIRSQPFRGRPRTIRR